MSSNVSRIQIRFALEIFVLFLIHCVDLKCRGLNHVLLLKAKSLVDKHKMIASLPVSDSFDALMICLGTMFRCIMLRGSKINSSNVCTFNVMSSMII